MKNFCEKQLQHRQWQAVFVDVWSLNFYRTFCFTYKRMNICVPLLRRSQGLKSSASCCSLLFIFCRGLLLLLLLFFFFFFRLVFNTASLSTWFRVSVSNQNFTDGFLLKFDFFFLAVAQHLQWSALFRLLSMTGHSFRNQMPRRYELLPQWQQNRTKPTLWLLHKIPAIQGCPGRIIGLTAVCCMLLAHNPYRAPQHYKRHICGTSCSCKDQFLWISLIFKHLFCWNIWVQYVTEIYGYSMSLKTFLVKN